MVAQCLSFGFGDSTSPLGVLRSLRRAEVKISNSEREFNDCSGWTGLLVFFCIRQLAFDP